MGQGGASFIYKYSSQGSTGEIIEYVFILRFSLGNEFSLGLKSLYVRWNILTKFAMGT